MDWSGVVWIWRDVSLTVGGAMRSVRWDQTVVNHARVIQSDAYTDAETVPKITSFIHTFIHWRFIIAIRVVMSYITDLKSWNASIFCILLSEKKFCKAFIGKSWQNLTSTSNVLWRHDWCHARWISAYIWRIFAFFVLNGLHLLHQVTKN